MWEFSVLPAQFFCETKTVVLTSPRKYSLFKNKQINKQNSTTTNCHTHLTLVSYISCDGSRVVDGLGTLPGSPSLGQCAISCPRWC